MIYREISTKGQLGTICLKQVQTNKIHKLATEGTFKKTVSCDVRSYSCKAVRNQANNFYPLN